MSTTKHLSKQAHIRSLRRLHSRTLVSARGLKLVVTLGYAALLFGCGGGSSSPSASNGSLSGNWQITTFNTDGTFLGGLQGGFLLQKNNTVTGQMVYAISLPAAGMGATPTLCSAGSAQVTGTVSGETVNLTAVAGTQTFTFTGALSMDGSTISGTYSSTSGSLVTDPNDPQNMVACGTVQTGQQWTATSVPPLNGAVKGSFHSTGSGSVPSMRDQDFTVTGSLAQGPNIGASSATVSGTLTFNNYPCVLTPVSVAGEISGNSVILQIVAQNGTQIGQIGAEPGIAIPSPVVLTSAASGGLVLQGANGYGVSTSSCKAGNIPGDVGNICLALQNSNACTEPLTLSPALLAFPVEPLGAPATTQTVTLKNTDPSGATLNGLQLAFKVTGTSDSSNPSDFNLLPSFSEQDTCAATPGASFSLAPNQSCTISVSFAPQQSCPWLPIPGLGGAAPSQCAPFFGTTISAVALQAANLTVTNPTSLATDSDSNFAVPVTGAGVSLVRPSTPEIDFGSEALSESSLPQLLSFTNNGSSPVQILPGMASPPCGKPNQPVLLPRPLIAGAVPGIQIVTGSISLAGSTVAYTCDVDPTSDQPNFQITDDTCSGALLAPQQSCSLAITFAPQPGTPQTPPPDYFVELNTLQCTDTTTTNCEIDAGRFPVELKVNPQSPLRISPAADLEFGIEPQGVPTDPPLTITLFNDPNDPNSQTIIFNGLTVKGDYAVINNCRTSLAPGASCTMDVIFTPKHAGFDPGSITFTYNSALPQTISLRGTGQ